MAFESVHQYVSDLKFYIHEVNEGMYIQQSLESILQDVEGKQLLVCYDKCNGRPSSISVHVFSHLQTKKKNRLKIII